MTPQEQFIAYKDYLQELESICKVDDSALHQFIEKSNKSGKTILTLDSHSDEDASLLLDFASVYSTLINKWKSVGDYLSQHELSQVLVTDFIPDIYSSSAENVYDALKNIDSLVVRNLCYNHICTEEDIRRNIIHSINENDKDGFIGLIKTNNIDITNLSKAVNFGFTLPNEYVREEDIDLWLDYQDYACGTYNELEICQNDIKAVSIKWVVKGDIDTTSFTRCVKSSLNRLKLWYRSVRSEAQDFQKLFDDPSISMDDKFRKTTELALFPIELMMRTAIVNYYCSVDSIKNIIGGIFKIPFIKPVWERLYSDYIQYLRANHIAIADDQENNVEQLQGLPEIQKALPYFKKAIIEGLMEKEGNQYRWNESKRLADYFLAKIYGGDYANVDGKWMPGGCGEIPRLSLSKLFVNIHTPIGQQRDNAIATALNVPKGYERIDALF